MGDVREEFLDEETHKKKLEQYMELRERNIRKCHFSYRRKI
jgi:hypothetical protein